MGATTKIQWCDSTANPWTGCQHARLSDGTEHPGCLNCYAERFSGRNVGTLGKWGADGTRVYHSNFWANCRKWNKQAAKAGVIRTVFPSMCDPFENWQGPMVDAKGEQLMHVPGVGSCPISEAEPGDPMFHAVTIADLRHALFSLIDECPNLLFLLLTKRPGNVREMYVPHCLEKVRGHVSQNEGDGYHLKPRPNVAIVASVSDQASADELIPDLLKCRDLCKYLGVSAEPLTGPVDLGEWLCPCDDCNKCIGECGCKADLDLCIIGGESGPNARPCNVEDIRSLVAQCKAAEVACFVKQLGSNIITRNDMVEDTFSDGFRGWPEPEVEHHIHGFREDYQGADCRIRLRDPKGGNPEEWPEDLRVRQLPWRAEK